MKFQEKKIWGGFNFILLFTVSYTRWILNLSRK
jgi:hypothetical protein